jgi:hypothetical protein
MASLFALVGFRINRWLGWAFVGFVMMVWMATVFFGWHYIVDGPVGVAMMFGIWKLAEAIAALAYPQRKHDAKMPQLASYVSEMDQDSDDWQAERAA